MEGEQAIMAMRPTLRLLWQRPLARFALLAFLLMGAAAWYITTRGGWVNALHLPPVLDASTPRSQNGFTLLDVQIPGQQQTRYGQAFAGFQFGKVDFQKNYGTDAIDTADAFGLWIDPPPLPDSLPASGDVDSQLNTLGKTFSVSARLSTGDVLPLDWHLRSPESLSLGEAAKRLLFIGLPSGYSNACQFVDFTISDQTGHATHWRIIRLPRMRHAVPPTPDFTDTVTKNGISVSAKAWHEKNGLVSYLLHPVLPPKSHQWDVITTGEWHEWEPFNYDGHRQVYKNSGTPILGRNGIFTTGIERWYSGGIHNFAGFDPYPHMNRFLRLTTEMHQFETYDETVTFHNLAVKQDWDGPSSYSYKFYYLVIPHPLTITTPSGVSVTLPAQGKRDAPMMSIGDLNFQMSVTAFDHPTRLARSPLVRQFGRPVTTSVQFASPYDSAGQSLSPGDMQAYSLSPPNNPGWHLTPKGAPYIPFELAVPPVLKDFTVIVRQRVDLQVIPMDFTLPITDGAPPYYPEGYHPPKSP